MIRDLLASWRGGLVFTGVFLMVALIRLAVMHPGPDVLFGILTALPQLVIIFGVGCLLTLPLLRLVRRHPERHRLLVGMWTGALPISAFLAVVGGLLGPLGILVGAALPVLMALGVARLFLALTAPP